MEYFATGVMSGTSLDGMDIACCRFILEHGKWHYTILYADTIPYTLHWEKLLGSAHMLSSPELMALHMQYGQYIGQQLNSFFNRHHIDQPGIIGSHGHTIFHQPEHGFTFQLGHGAAIAATTKKWVICDFRTMDVALGGQGAPLVPIGDEHLFSAYDCCLNLGGFANLSAHVNGNRIAFDICPVNIIPNRIIKNTLKASPSPAYERVSGENRHFDRNGETGRKGTINTDLLHALNNLEYYKLPAPKSLGAEWVEATIWPLLESFHISLEDKLRTYYEHLAIQLNEGIANCNADKSPLTVLMTGGGSHNGYLVERIKSNATARMQFILPDRQTIDYKEAVVFAFLGVLHLRKEANSLATATGAARDAIGGGLYIGDNPEATPLK